MKITIIYGSPRKGCSYNAVGVVKNELQKKYEVEFKEYFLPKDMPEFCCGCFNCFMKGEDYCPHAKYIQPIIADMIESDGLIFTSPVYALAVSAAAKSLLDHLAYIFIPHRPRKEMFTKKAFIISTTAGAGTRNSMKTIADSLRYWGVNRIYRCGLTMWGISWDEIDKKRKQKCLNKLTKTAARFGSDVSSHKRHIPYPIQRIMFTMCGKLIKGFKDDRKADYEYWEKNGWFSGKTPFKD